jgi:hypothetical protein
LPKSITKDQLAIVNDGFAQLINTKWKGTGVAIPVFSLRSNKSAGIGEFSDLKYLVDWSKKNRFKTNSTFTAERYYCHTFLVGLLSLCSYFCFCFTSHVFKVARSN